MRHRKATHSTSFLFTNWIGFPVTAWNRSPPKRYSSATKSDSISVQEPVVGSNGPEDAFMEHILVGMAEFYSKNLAREIRKGLTERIRQGFLVFRPPYGYRREVIDKQQGRKGFAQSADPRWMTWQPVSSAGFSRCPIGASVTKKSPKSSTTTDFEPLRDDDLPVIIFIGSSATKRTSACSNTISVNATSGGANDHPGILSAHYRS